MSEVRVWLRPNGNVVVNVADDPMFFEVSRTRDVIGLTGSNELPVDVELLVGGSDFQKLKDERTHLLSHVNEIKDALEDVDDASDSIGEGVRSLVARLKELNNPYSPLNQQSSAWRIITKHPLIGPISTLPERDTYADMVKARLDQLEKELAECASTTFDPKSPDALRQAADVIEATSPPFSDFAASTMRSATDLRTEADRLERETKAQAAREALVEEMARAGYEAVDAVLANGDPSRLHHWDSFTQGKEHHRIIARALLGDPRFKIERVEDE